MTTQTAAQAMAEICLILGDAAEPLLQVIPEAKQDDKHLRKGFL